jgi:hypothetical protein
MKTPSNQTASESAPSKANSTLHVSNQSALDFNFSRSIAMQTQTTPKQCIQQYKLEDTRSPSIEAGSNGFANRIRFPQPNSISGKVLADMLCGDHVSVESMYRHYGAALGSNCVKDLRRNGWPIQRSEVHFSDPRDGSTKALALYYLPPATIVAVGLCRQDFLLQVRNASQDHQAKGRM